MVRIPTFQRTATLPGAQRLRATPEDFGGGVGHALQFTGNLLANFAEKKQREETELYISRTTSEAMKNFTRRRLDLRNEIDGDITPFLSTEMASHVEGALGNAPNEDAARKAEISLNTMFTSMLVKSATGDELSRTKRRLTQFDTSHQNNRSSVYDDFDTLKTVIPAESAELDGMRIPPADKDEKRLEFQRELAFDAFQGLIDRDETGAREALKMMQLNDAKKNPELKWLDKGDRQSLVRYANQTIKTHESDEDRLFARAERRRRVGQRDEENRLFDDFLDGGLNLKGVKKSKLDSRNKQWLLKVMEAQNRQPPSPVERASTYTSLLNAVDFVQDETDFENANNAVRESMAENLISYSQGMALITRLENPATKARKLVETVLKSTLTRTNQASGMIDPDGDKLYLQSYQDIESAIRTKIANNEPTAPLFDPNNDEYIGDFLVEKYSRTQAQINDSIMRGFRRSTDQAEDVASDQDIIDTILEGLKGTLRPNE